MRALAHMKAPGTVELITAALKDPDATIRYEAFCSFYLLEHWDLELAAKLMKEDPSPLVASEAMWYLHYKAYDLACQEALLKRNDTRPRVRSIAAQILAEQPTLETFPYLLAGLMDSDFEIHEYYRQGLEKVVRAHPPERLIEKIKTLPSQERKQVEKYLTSVSRDHILQTVLELLQKAKGNEVDIEALSEFGTSLTEMAKAGRLWRAYGLDAQVELLMQLLTSQKRLSILILGEPGTGKTALIHELTCRLASQTDLADTHVIEVSTGQLISGTLFLGEWQTKLLRFLEHIRSPKPVLWYVSNPNDLLTAGTSFRSTENFFSVLQPFLERKEICLIGESTPQDFARGLGQNPSARALFHTVALHPKTAEETKTILRRVREDLVRRNEKEGQILHIPEEMLDRIIDLSGNYFPNIAFPGKAVTFLRFLVQVETERVASNASPPELTVGLDAMYHVLSKLTGMPVDLIDDRLPLDLEKTRAFFRERILGQQEAVATVIDVITLIKAGLTDPGKPMGVLFFVGPTGVGKTELAKSIAEYIFGSADRMIRLDMSEYQDYQSIDRLIGTLYQPGLLTSKIRQQPFAVILLDEIEKGHPSLFDLLLQVFDDGRLTDAQGALTDFRQTIIVMTSNIGSQIQARASIGFDSKTFTPGQETVLQQVTLFFRPEFINRIDKIIVFRPLDVSHHGEDRPPGDRQGPSAERHRLAASCRRY